MNLSTADDATFNRRDRRAASAARRRAGGQNAILDRGLSGILATVAIIGVLGSYFLFSGTNNAQSQQNQLSAISAQVGNLFGTQAQFTGLSATVIANSGALSPSWVTGAGTASAGLVSIYKSPITLAPVANPVTALANGAYTMTIGGLPNAACVQLATNNIGPNELGVMLPGGSAPVAGAVLPTPAAATAACTGGSNTLVFYMT